MFSLTCRYCRYFSAWGIGRFLFLSGHGIGGRLIGLPINRSIPTSYRSLSCWREPSIRASRISVDRWSLAGSLRLLSNSWMCPSPSWTLSRTGSTSHITATLYNIQSFCDTVSFINISHESFAKILALKIESFKISEHFSKFQKKIVIQNVGKNKNNEKHSICHFSTEFLGAGK